MKKAYSQLYNLNKDLMTGYKIRSNNHMQLLECLKIVNQAIQKAGKLRGDVLDALCISLRTDNQALIILFPPLVGKAKSSVISLCREAVKTNDVEALLKAIRTGAS